MIRLITFGAPQVSAPGSSAQDNVMGQPKRALLLAYLATARPRGFHRRETLLALLWPELDEARGRQALRQVLYMLRRAVGRDAIASRGEDELGLNAAAVWVDAREFEDALAAGRPEQALALYGGDFLSGLHVPDGSAELDEWIEDERQRYRAMAASAAWSLARESEAAGNRVQAAHWAHRAASLSPTDEDSVAQLISLLHRSGDRTGAVRAYEDYARRLRTLLELEPSPRIRNLIKEVQASPGSPSLESPRRVASRRNTPLGLVSAGDARLPAATPTTPPTPPAPVAIPPRTSPAPDHPARRRRLWWVLVPTGLAAIALLAVTLALRARSPHPGRQVFAVGEFRDVSRPDSARPVPVLADLLATSLARLPTLQVLSGARLLELESQLGARRGSSGGAIAAARAGGATVLVQGTVATTSGQRVLGVELVDIGTGRIHASLEVQGRDLFELVDRATAAMAERYGLRAPDQPVASVTTRSLLGYRFYEEGLRAFFHGDISAARRLFEAALGEDSSFAMAAFYAAMAMARPEYDTALARANRLADRVSERERLLIRATWQADQQDPAALATAESLVVRYPSDPTGHRILGTMQLTRGEFAAAVGHYRRVITMDSLSLAGRSPMCAACDAYHELATTYQYWDSLPKAAAVAREWMARRPGDPAPWASLTATLEWQSDDAAWEVARQAETRFGRPIQPPWVPAVLAIRNGRHEEADRRLRAMLADGDSATRAQATWYLAISLRDQGRLAEAVAIRPTDSLVRAIVDIERGGGREAARYLTARARLTAPLTPGHVARNRTWQLTHLATAYYRLGDTARLAPLADSVEQAGQLSLFGRDGRLHHYVRGLLARSRGDLSAAERELRATVYSWNAGYTRINVELARTLLDLNRPREAVAVLRPALRGSIEASNLYVTRTELHELLARAFTAAGEPDSARAHYQWVEAAWRNADPHFRSRYEAARRALAH